MVFNIYFKEIRWIFLFEYKIFKIIEIKEKVFENVEVGDNIIFFGEENLIFK